MFGHDKTQDDTDDTAVQVSVVPSTTDAATSTPVATEPEDELNLPAPAFETLADEPEELGAPEITAEEEPAEEAPAEQIPVNAVPDSEPPMPAPVSDMEPATPEITINTSGAMKDLSSLRQEALHELSPLINHLDQTPEEKYATAKMVYEETNDQALLTSVYDAAKNLSDEKAKAEAIYDVIKKINEFTAKN